MSTIYAMPLVLSLMGHAWSKQGRGSGGDMGMAT
jgi:hypothetical protein